MKYIIAAMNKHGVRRLIALSTASSKDPNDKPGIKIKTMITFVKTASPDAYADIVSWSEVIRALNLDWTLVRVLLLNDKPKQEISRPAIRVVMSLEHKYPALI